MENKYPECKKMAAVRDQSQVIGEFLEWLANEKETWICKREEEDRTYYLWGFSVEIVLAEFFGINLNKVDEEKRQMLDEIRRENELE